MKRIEPPPASVDLREWYNALGETERQFIALWAGMTGVLRDIDSEYLYWDKVKYKKIAEIEGLLDHKDLWMLVKNSRRKEYKKISIGRETFYFLHTERLHENLHQFDLNLGGTLGGQQPIGETDRYQYLLGSIMESRLHRVRLRGPLRRGWWRKKCYARSVRHATCPSV